MDFYSATQLACGREFTAHYKPVNEPVPERSLAGESRLSEKYDALQQQHTSLSDQHEKLKKHFASLSETVQVLGSQSSQTTMVAQQAQDLKVDLINQHLKTESRLQGQLQQANDLKLDLIKRHTLLQAQLEQEQNSKSDLMKRHSNLQQQLQQENISKADLMNRTSVLQAQLVAMKETVEALTVNCKASEDKLLLQSQLHSDKIRLLEVTHNTLKDRCKTISVSAEQHRMANIVLEERHKSMAKDMEVLAKGIGCDSSKDGSIRQLQSLISAKDRDISQLQSLVAAKDKNINMLQQLVSAKDTDIKTLQIKIQADSGMHNLKIASAEGCADKAHVKGDEISVLRSQIDSHRDEMKLTVDTCASRLHNKENEISSLMRNIESHKAETKRLQCKLGVTQSLLKSHPIDPCLNKKTKSILKSSADILELAHANGSAESMRLCLGQVGDTLQDLNVQLDTQNKLSNAWLDQIKCV